MEYRRAALQDIDELVAVRIEMRNECESPEGIDQTQFRENTYTYYRRHMANDNYVSWVAVENGRIISVSGICFYEVPPTYANLSGLVAYVMSVYTKPEYRRRGISQALFAELLKEAKQKGCTEITLGASDMGRPMYEKFGFTSAKDAMKLRLGS